MADADSTNDIMDNDSDGNSDTQTLQKRSKEHSGDEADDGRCVTSTQGEMVAESDTDGCVDISQETLQQEGLTMEEVEDMVASFDECDVMCVCSVNQRSTPDF